MNDNDRVIKNVNATMSMENMPLSKEDIFRIRQCLDGKVSYQDEIDKLINQHHYEKYNLILDKYHSNYEIDDKYCYTATSVLKNKLNITDENELKFAEQSITSLRIAQLMVNPIKGKLDFDYLKSIHKFIFNDIYDWAGAVRTVNIAKGNTFCRYEFIEEQINTLMKQLEKEDYLNNLTVEKLANRLAYYIGEINAIHPFREGNGRAQRMFIECLALHNGFSLDFSKISSDEMLEASIKTFNLDYKLMSKILLKALSIKK